MIILFALVNRQYWAHLDDKTRQIKKISLKTEWHRMNRMCRWIKWRHRGGDSPVEGLPPGLRQWCIAEGGGDGCGSRGSKAEMSGGESFGGLVAHCQARLSLSCHPPASAFHPQLRLLSGRWEQFATILVKSQLEFGQLEGLSCLVWRLGGPSRHWAHVTGQEAGAMKGEVSTSASVVPWSNIPSIHFTFTHNVKICIYAMSIFLMSPKQISNAIVGLNIKFG